MRLREELFELLRTDRGFREEVRRQVLTEELLALPALVQELVEAQRRTEEEIRLQGEQIQALAQQAQALGVAWKVGAERSDGLLAFRRRSPPSGAGRRSEGAS